MVLGVREVMKSAISKGLSRDFQGISEVINEMIYLKNRIMRSGKVFRLNGGKCRCG